MQIHIEVSNQIRIAIGVASESLQVADSCALPEALVQLLQLHPTLATWIDPTGSPRAGLLVFINDQSPRNHATTILHEQDQVSLVTLVSGG